MAKDTESLLPVLEYLSGFTTPLLLIANFAQIMNNGGKYRNLLLTHGLAALAVFGVSWFLFTRYCVGTIRLAVTEPDQVIPIMEQYFREHNEAGFVAFNMFVSVC